jgi:hypothetical protein
MAKQFDSTLNVLIDEHLSDWGAFLAAHCGVPPGPASALDTDLSATLQADRLFRIDGAVPAAIHLEMETSGRLGFPERLLRYNVAARGAVELPVHSVLVLLRPAANATDLTGELEVSGADGAVYLTFRYRVVRVWELPLAELLSSLGTAPLALLTNEASADLPTAFARFRERLKADAVPSNVERSLIGSTFVLCGLRYKPDQVEALYRELSMTLEDSSTYQLLIKRGEKIGEARGRAAEAQSLVLLLGGQRFGAPPAGTEDAVRAIGDRERLERIASRVLTATDWADLLATQ